MRNNQFLFFLNRNPKVFAILLSSFVAALMTCIIRYLLLSHLNLDIFNISDNPFCSLVVFFNSNIIRYTLKEYIGYLLSKPLLMNVEDMLNTPSPPAGNPGNNAPAGNPANNVPAGNPNGNSFNLHNGRYTIADPSNIGIRGYLNPNTGQPYGNNQPYANNLAAAMEHAANAHGSSTVGWNINAFDNNSRLFKDEFMRHNYPNRHPNQWWNSKPVRDLLRRQA